MSPTDASLQKIVLARLDAASDARVVVMIAPVGVGLASSLAMRLAEAARTGLVLIVVPSILLMEQWVSRTADAGADAVVLTADVALEIAEGNGLADGGRLIVTTAQRLLHGPGRLAAEMMRPSWLIVDGPMMTVSPGLQPLMDFHNRADRVLVLTSVPDLALGDLPEAHRIVLTLDELFPNRADTDTRVLVIRTLPDEAALATLSEAADLLGRSLSQVRAASRGAIHDDLLAFATGDVPLMRNTAGEAVTAAEVTAVPAVEASRERAWALLDRLEALDFDPRMVGVTSVVESLVAKTRVWVVSSRRIADAEYVYGHLLNAGFDVTLWTPRSGRLRPADTAPRVTVVTPGMLEYLSQVPDRIALVFASPPATQLELKRVEAWISADVLAVVAAVVDEIAPNPFALEKVGSATQD